MEIDTVSTGALTGACIGGFVVVIGVVIFYWIASSRKPAEVVKDKPANLQRLSTPLQYSEAINRVLGLAPLQGYKVEEVTPDGSGVILSTPLSFFNYGFFYPIYFSVEPGGSTLVEVGIKSRAFQWGPVVTNSQKKCFAMVMQAFMPYIPPSQPPYPNSQPPSPPPTIPG